MPVTGVSFCSMPRKNILDLLEGGDRRSLGRSDQVVAIVYKNQALFPELIEGWWSPDRFRLAAFQWYSRPGNIRELQNISKVQQASVSSNASIPSSANVASPCRVGRRAFACTICGTPLPPPNLPQLVATIGRQASGPHAVVETDRYAHVADAALRSASDVFGGCWLRRIQRSGRRTRGAIHLPLGFSPSLIC